MTSLNVSAIQQSQDDRVKSVGSDLSEALNLSLALDISALHTGKQSKRSKSIDGDEGAMSPTTTNNTSFENRCCSQESVRSKISIAVSGISSSFQKPPITNAF